MVGGNQVTLPFHAFAPVLEPEDAPIHCVGLGLDDVEVAVLIQVAYPDLNREPVAIGPVASGRCQAGAFGPLESFSVGVLEPHISANDVVVPVTVEISDAGRADTTVDTSTYLMLGPLVAGISGDLIPDRDFVVLLIADGDHVELAVAVDIARNVIVTVDGAAVEPLEGLGAGLAGVAIPSFAAELIDPSVAVDVEGRTAYVGAVPLTQVMPNPLIRTDVLKPPCPCALTDDPVEIAVVVNIHQRGLAHLPADPVYEVAFESRE